MAINLGKTIRVFKFKETGVVALCKEVSDYATSRLANIDGVDLSTARFGEDDYHYFVEFDLIKDGD